MQSGDREMTGKLIRIIFAWAKETLVLRKKDLARVFKVNPRTANRWVCANTTPSPGNRKKLYVLNDIRQLCERTFPNQKAASEWMKKSVPALNGSTPRSLILDGDLERVRSLLATIESGAFI